MNRQDSLRPVTRRALRIRYYSPATCFLPGDAYSGTSSDDASSLLDFVPTTRLPGPVLTVSNYTDTQLRLSWTSVTGAIYYQIYRATSPDGPFEFLFGPVAELFYLDTPPAPGMYYYQVTAIEPDAGQTEPSNTGSGEIVDPDPGIILPPVAGYSLWYAPESVVASDTGGTSPVVLDNTPISFWEDLSGNGNHAVFPGGNAVNPPILRISQINSLRGIRFGEDISGGQVRTGLLTGANVPLSGGITVFCVGGFRTAPGATEPAAQFVAYNGIDLLMRAHPLNDRYFEGYHNSGGTQIFSSVDRGTADYVRTLRFNDGGNEFRQWVNGILDSTSPDGGLLPPDGPVALGYRTDTGITCHLNGNICEVIIYPTSLSDSDRAAVENFLMEKYAL